MDWLETLFDKTATTKGRISLFIAGLSLGAAAVGFVHLNWQNTELKNVQIQHQGEKQTLQAQINKLEFDLKKCNTGADSLLTAKSPSPESGDATSNKVLIQTNEFGDNTATIN